MALASPQREHIRAADEVGVVSMAVIVPSRGRPQNVVALIEAWSAPEAALIICVDEDDPEFPAYEAIERPAGAFLLTSRIRMRLGEWLNAAIPLAATQHDIVGFMGDDHRPRSDEWDFHVIEAMVPGGVVYGNDLIQGANLPTAVFMDSRIVRTLGWFVIPGMTHLFMDNLWKTLGEQLGTLRYLPDVIIEHVHPLKFPELHDVGYAEANAPEVWQHDKAIYDEWVAFQMPVDIAKIRAAL